MSSTNKTEKLKLNQWVPEDPVLREDFNRDNQLLDQVVASLSARLDDSQKNIYDLLLQNDYDGKVTENCLGISFDGFIDTDRCSDSMGCSWDSEARRLNIGADWCTGPLANEPDGDLVSQQDLSSASPNPGAYIRFFNSSACFLETVHLHLYPQWGYENQQSVFRLEIVNWDNTLQLPTDQVIADSGEVVFVPTTGQKAQPCDFPINAQIPAGLFCLRITMLRTSYAGTNRLFTAGVHAAAQPKYAWLYDGSKNLFKHTNDFASPVYSFTFSQPDSGERFLTALPAAMPEAASARIYVRHSAGSVTVSVLDADGQSIPAELTGSRPATELLGTACLESTFLCDLSQAAAPDNYRLQLRFEPGDNEQMHIYDYGVIWMQ